MAASDELASNAADFSRQLKSLAKALDADLSQVIRLSVFKVFSNIVKRSPVDTGAYRASHAIANAEPGDKDGIVTVKKPKGRKQGETPLIGPPTLKGWSWKVGDGDIWIYNNLPYAERIENGWSQQAPAGVYGLALIEIGNAIKQELAKYPGFSPDSGGTE
jgi:hypothetical protein